jgi:hypothetical protein
MYIICTALVLASRALTSSSLRAMLEELLSAAA